VRWNPFSPTVDGVEMTGEAWELARAGVRAPVPLILGSNRDEMSATYFETAPFDLDQTGLVALVPLLAPIDSTRVEQLLALYPVDEYPTTECCTPQYWQAIRIASDWSMTCPSRRAARWLSSTPTWLYLFNHLTDLGDPPVPFEFVPHASQRAYVFRDFNLISNEDKSLHGALELIATLGAYWTNMAKIGQPQQSWGGVGASGLQATRAQESMKAQLPWWPAYDNATDVLAVLDTNVSTMARFREQKCDMMDRLLTDGPALYL
jgi:carboxylesterase type B